MEDMVALLDAPALGPIAASDAGANCRTPYTRTTSGTIPASGGGL